MITEQRRSRGRVSKENVRGALEIYLGFANPARATDKQYLARVTRNLVTRYRRTGLEGIARINFDNLAERICCPAYLVVRKEDDPVYRGIHYALEIYTTDPDLGGMGTEGFSLGGFIENPKGESLAWKIIRKWMDEGYPTLYQGVM